ncbi:hypothetical protein QF001_001749 [Paraburkholderia youngii]|uniref:hypothetical protein n=1 Tax=Paraburkholderia youngii TaxID=2782701 RepID=UPI003D20A431
MQLLTHLAAVEKDFASAAKEPTGTLRIASANSFAVSELPRVLSAYHSIEPKVPLEVSIIENTGVDENRRLVPTAARSFNDFVLSHYRVQASESDAEISVNRSVELHRLVFRSRGGL